MLIPSLPFLKGVTDHILANIVEEYPSQGILKTYRIIRPATHKEMVLAKAITLYTVWNEIGATLNM